MSRDVYVCLAIAAISTRRIQLAHGVTDPVTYRPWVIANATATIDELSGGRAFVGLGAGGPYGKEMKSRPVKEVRAAVEFIRRYSRGEEAEFDGVRMRSEWVRRPLRVYIGCAGPKMLQLAGEIADGVMLASNADPVCLQWRLEQIAKGAQRAGRDPAAIDVWARGMIYVTDRPEAAHREVAGYAVNSARSLHRLMLQPGPEVNDLRQRVEEAHPGLLEDCRRVFEAWTPDQHEKIDTAASRAVTRRIIETQHLAGTPAEICEKLARLGELGIRTFATVTYTLLDKQGMVSKIGERIISRLRD
jgi:5,10-methylenetetrahydromethanopterin reductase